MSDNELLLALSEMMDKKLEPIKDELTTIRVDLLENNVIPRLNTIENCYLSTFNKYSVNADKMESLISDMEVLKRVVLEHSEKLQKIS